MSILRVPILRTFWLGINFFVIFYLLFVAALTIFHLPKTAEKALQKRNLALYMDMEALVHIYLNF